MPQMDRGRSRRTRSQACEAPSDGDNEETDGEDHGSESEENVLIAESPEKMVKVEPRRLRNGKNCRR